ncbi:thiamine phosphate synthase [Helicobacter sp. 11S03491-1]|uniref:thiamine phosphate synthase n=1 Tax=Helicobacter sp. 11S03491-1 TaxID=1476196 RepID=UPI0021519AEC|nr:thiamine phosphate synthase [Helicobacter sp. 11S03491-1]
MKLKGLYGISDDLLTPSEKIFEMLYQAILGGLKIFQLRDKIQSDTALLELAIKIRDFCFQNDVLFVINDRVELAIKINAPALHIGSEDCSLLEAKRHFKGKIGVSCYDRLDLALQAQKNGANYVAFGAFFASQTKPEAKKIPLDILKEAKKILKIPICAIGGIDCQNAIELKQADMIAVIGGLWRGNVQKNAQLLLKNWQEK